jgi:DNA-binding MarR family transcriptional regulator
MAGGTSDRGRPFDRRAVSFFMIWATLLHGHRNCTMAVSVPAWAVLMSLYHRDERGPPTTKALCAAAGIPLRSALRLIDELVETGLVVAMRDPADGRQRRHRLSDEAIDRLNGYFDELVRIAADPEAAVTARRSAAPRTSARGPGSIVGEGP